MAIPRGMPPPGPGEPPAYVAPAEPGPSDRSRLLLLYGSLIRISGAIVVGISFVMLGLWISSPITLVNPADPNAPFRALGTITIVAGFGTILTGVGWSMQTWGRGS